MFALASKRASLVSDRCAAGWRAFVAIPSLEIFKRALKYSQNTAIVSENKPRTYLELLTCADAIRQRLLPQGQLDLNEERVALFYSGSYAYTAVKWGVWAAGGVAVPLHVGHPAPELEYIIKDSGSKIVVAPREKAVMLRQICEKVSKDTGNTVSLLETAESDFLSQVKSDEVHTTRTIDASRRALVIYTSGTTGKPKGVVTTHHNIEAQIKALVEAWEWRSSDHILHVLPVHHIHGVINVLACALWSGAKCTFPVFPSASFDPERTWQYFKEENLTLFMAVPTIYSILIKQLEACNDAQRAELTETCEKFRLMVSGSAALPISTLEKWRAITGHTLLERYGMTETGMILSNAYRGTRYPGMVGFPLPGVEVKLVDSENGVGELRVKGPGVFKEYWGKPQATAQTFDPEGWFLTGDQASYSPEGGYRILGRSSTDILKTAGFKVSALDIEEVLRQHPDIAECAVVGLPSEEFGQIVAAIVVPRAAPNATAAQPDAKKPLGLDVAKVRAWCRKELASYKVPRKFVVMEAIPKNAMGKVNKKDLVKVFSNN